MQSTATKRWHIAMYKSQHFSPDFIGNFPEVGETHADGGCHWRFFRERINGSFMFLYISGSQSGRNRPLGAILRVKVAKQHKGAKTLNSMGSIVSHIIFG